ncbi:MAG: hypothetical protein AAFN10_12680, partial [Bacteroidota bacterium]
IQNRMSQRVSSPDPDFYIEQWNREGEPRFLGGMLAHQGASYEIRFVPEQSAWRLDAGYRDGLRAQHPVTGEMSIFDVFEVGVPPEAMAQGEGFLGQVGAERVRARSSWVIPMGNVSLNPEASYVARLNRLPIERLRFHLDEESLANQELIFFKNVFFDYIKSDREKEIQLYLRPEEDQQKPQYFLQADGQKVYLSHKKNRSRPILVARSNENGDHHIPSLFRQMIHLSKWDNILNLSNPNSQIDERQLLFEIIDASNNSPLPIDTNGYELAVSEPQKIRIRLQNLSDQALYFGLLYLSSDLAVSPIPLSEGGNLLEAGQSIMAIDGETASLAFSRRQQEMGQSEATDYFKLIASPEPFNSQILEMLDIDRQSEKGPERSIVNWTNTHSLLFDETGGRYQDWNTRLYRVKMIFNPS